MRKVVVPFVFAGALVIPSASLADPPVDQFADSSVPPAVAKAAEGKKSKIASATSRKVLSVMDKRSLMVTTKTASEDEFLFIAQLFLASRAELLISGGAHSEARKVNDLFGAPTSATEVENLEAARKKVYEISPAARQGQARVSLVVNKLSVSGNRAEMIVTDSTRMLEGATPSDDDLGWDVERKFIFKKDKASGSWRLDFHKALVGDGPDAWELPSTDLNAKVPAAADLPEVPAVIPADGPNTELTTVATPRAKGYSGRKATRRATAIDRSDTATYAKAWWDKVNSGFRQFTNDCTNFASQALRSGGWTQRSGAYDQYPSWYYSGYDLTKISRTWRVADDLERHMRLVSGRAAQRSSEYTSRTGDIAFFNWSGDSVWDHAGVITYHSSDPFAAKIAYHTGTNGSGPASGRHRNLFEMIRESYGKDNRLTIRVYGVTNA